MKDLPISSAGPAAATPNSTACPVVTWNGDWPTINASVRTADNQNGQISVQFDPYLFDHISKIQSESDVLQANVQLPDGTSRPANNEELRQLARQLWSPNQPVINETPERKGLYDNLAITIVVSSGHWSPMTPFATPPATSQDSAPPAVPATGKAIANQTLFQ